MRKRCANTPRHIPGKSIFPRPPRRFAFPQRFPKPVHKIPQIDNRAGKPPEVPPSDTVPPRRNGRAAPGAKRHCRLFDSHRQGVRRPLRDGGVRNVGQTEDMRNPAVCRAVRAPLRRRARRRSGGDGLIALFSRLLPDKAFQNARLQPKSDFISISRIQSDL